MEKDAFSRCCKQKKKKKHPTRELWREHLCCMLGLLPNFLFVPYQNKTSNKAACKDKWSAVKPPHQMARNQTLLLENCLSESIYTPTITLCQPLCMYRQHTIHHNHEAGAEMLIVHLLTCIQVVIRRRLFVLRMHCLVGGIRRTIVNMFSCIWHLCFMEGDGAQECSKRRQQG